MKKVENNIQKTETALLVCLGNKKHIPCFTFKEASDIIKAFVYTKDLGSSKFYSINNVGLILHHNKGVIAHVSYNGRVWKGSDSFMNNKEEVTDLLSNDI